MIYFVVVLFQFYFRCKSRITLKLRCRFTSVSSNVTDIVNLLNQSYSGTPSISLGRMKPRFSNLVRTWSLGCSCTRTTNWPRSGTLNSSIPYHTMTKAATSRPRQNCLKTVSRLYSVLRLNVTALVSGGLRLWTRREALSAFGFKEHVSLETADRPRLIAHLHTFKRESVLP